MGEIDKKPPLGIFPPSCVKWYVTRYYDIEDAKRRFRKAGKKIPIEWLEEQRLIVEIRNLPIPKKDNEND